MAITPGDELPLHQSARPLRDAGTDRNLYDRAFFSGHDDAGDVYFAMAFGQYPGRDVMDAAFSVTDVADGTRTQHNLRVSRQLGDDRLDTQVGPIRIEVVLPLHRVRVVVDDADSGLAADLLFTARAAPFEEPRYTLRAGHRTTFDYTRLTQSGTWTGTLSVPGGVTHDVQPGSWSGERDRSWGIRPVGEHEGFGPPTTERMGFYWIWAPVQLGEWCYLFDVNERCDGSRWHEGCMAMPFGGSAADVLVGTAEYHLDFAPATRHARAFSVDLALPSGTETLDFEPRYPFFMQGIGYTNPEWGHGVWKGPYARAFDQYDVATQDRTLLPNQHIQAVSRVRRRRDGAEAVGILEQLIIGPHDPSGLTSILDMAP